MATTKEEGMSEESSPDGVWRPEKWVHDEWIVVRYVRLGVSVVRETDEEFRAHRWHMTRHANHWEAMNRAKELNQKALTDLRRQISNRDTKLGDRK